MKVNAELKRVAGVAMACVVACAWIGCAGMSTGGIDGEDQLAASEDISGEAAAGEASIDEAAAAGTTEAVLPETGQPDLQAAAGPRLLALRIEAAGGGNRLITEMAAAGFYTFTKTAPSEYVLTLEGATMDAAAGEVQVAPREQGKIRSVRPIVQGNNVVVRIFAESETMLTARARGNQIIVAPYNEAAQNADEVMAQAALEGEPEAASSPSATVTVEETQPAEQAAEEGALPEEGDLAELLTAEERYTGRLISLDLQDTDIDNALRIIAEVSNLNIIASDEVTGKVTLRLIDVPWDQALDVILKTNGLDKVKEGNVIRIAPVEKLRQEREALKMAELAQQELEPLKVQYIRVSYAKAAQLQPLVETVITERGSVAYDERTNQLIVKDISKGLRNVSKLVQKLDLRTPQVLIETQIVEAERTFTRDLGAEMGFFYLRSPETGNATSYNFPNSVAIGGSALAGGTEPSAYMSSYAAGDQRSAVSVLLGSADGSKGLRLRLSQGERDGRARVVSRPSVAVTNNTPAEIKAVTKLRVKLPDGGTNVATGQGAAASGTSVATETIEVGIILQVTAQASPDYYVLMDIDAKSSTLGNPELGVDNIPPEVERHATSTVLVSSGQTFALGGIYKTDEREQVDGVPWVKDIPVLGHFFRSSSVSDKDQELIFFITPRIIEGSFDDSAMKSAT